MAAPGGPCRPASCRMSGGDEDRVLCADRAARGSARLLRPAGRCQRGRLVVAQRWPAQRRPAGTDRSQPGARRGRAWASMPSRLVTARQVHGATALAVSEPWDNWQAPEADALVDRPAGPAAWRARGRLRPGAAGRRRGWRDRRRTCRLEGCAGRRARSRGGRDDRAGSTARPDHGRLGALHRPGVLRGRARSSSIASPRRAGQRGVSSGPPGDKALFDLKGFIVMRLRRAGVGRSTYCRTTPAPRTAGSSAIAARRCGARSGFGLQLSAIVAGRHDAAAEDRQPMKRHEQPRRNSAERAARSWIADRADRADRQALWRDRHRLQLGPPRRLRRARPRALAALQREVPVPARRRAGADRRASQPRASGARSRRCAGFAPSPTPWAWRASTPPPPRRSGGRPTARTWWRRSPPRPGSQVRVLSGAEEAHFAALGVISGFFRPIGLVGDMGGGSLEVAEALDDRVGERWVSLPLGALPVEALLAEGAGEAKRRIDALLQGGPAAGPDRARVLRRRRRLAGARQGAHGGGRRARCRWCTATRWTPTRRATSPRSCGTCRRPSSRRCRACRRAASRTLPAAALVLDRVLKHLAPERVVFSALGLREGWLYSQLPEAERYLDPLVEGAQLFGLPLARVPALRAGPGALDRRPVPRRDRRPTRACGSRSARSPTSPGATTRTSGPRRASAACCSSRSSASTMPSGCSSPPRSTPAMPASPTTAGWRRRSACCRRATAPARQILGRAILLGYRLSGGVPEILANARLQIDADQRPARGRQRGARARTARWSATGSSCWRRRSACADRGRGGRRGSVRSLAGAKAKGRAPARPRQDRPAVQGCGSSALPRLEARVGLVDDVDPALAPHQPAILVPGLGGLERVSDLHGWSPCRRLLLAAEILEAAVELLDLAALEHLQRAAGPGGVRLRSRRPASSCRPALPQVERVLKLDPSVITTVISW